MEEEEEEENEEEEEENEEEEEDLEEEEEPWSCYQRYLLKILLTFTIELKIFFLESWIIKFMLVLVFLKSTDNLENTFRWLFFRVFVFSRKKLI